MEIVKDPLRTAYERAVADARYYEEKLKDALALAKALEDAMKRR